MRRSVLTARSVTKARSAFGLVRLDQLAALHQARDRRVHLRQRVAPRRVAERHRPDLRLRDAHPPFLDMRHRPRNRLRQAPVSGSYESSASAVARASRKDALSARTAAPSRGSFGRAGARLRRLALVPFFDRPEHRHAGHRRSASPVSGSSRLGGASAALSRTRPSRRARARQAGTSSARPRSRLGLRVRSARLLRVRRRVAAGCGASARPRSPAAGPRTPPRTCANSPQARSPGIASDQPRDHRHAERLQPARQLVAVVPTRSASRSA